MQQQWGFLCLLFSSGLLVHNSVFGTAISIAPGENFIGSIADGDSLVFNTSDSQWTVFVPIPEPQTVIGDVLWTVGAPATSENPYIYSSTLTDAHSMTFVVALGSHLWPRFTSALVYATFSIRSTAPLSNTTVMYYTNLDQSTILVADNHVSEKSWTAPTCAGGWNVEVQHSGSTLFGRTLTIDGHATLQDNPGTTSVGIVDSDSRGLLWNAHKDFEEGVDNPSATSARSNWRVAIPVQSDRYDKSCPIASRTMRIASIGINVPLWLTVGSAGFLSMGVAYWNRAKLRSLWRDRGTGEAYETLL